MGRGRSTYTEEEDYMKLLKQAIDTLFIVSLFCLITLGLPLILPVVSHQVYVYVIMGVVTGVIIQKGSK